MCETVEALKEHYGVELSATVINKVTQEIGKQARDFNAGVEPQQKTAPLLVVEIDGSMVPIVEYGEAGGEQKEQGLKRNRQCFWKEFRLCTVNEPGSGQTTYGVTAGTPFEAGCMMYAASQFRGMNMETRIHGVGDGAPWIADQYEEQFGANHTFYIDFYHVSEYLGNASKELGEESGSSQWFEEQKQKLRNNKESEVVAELAVLASEQPDKEALETCHRYLENRLEHLNYASALARDLPIGSGEVESGHRSVLQKRLKKPGAWWTMRNAQTMAQLKTLQANKHWDELWQNIAA